MQGKSCWIELAGLRILQCGPNTLPVILELHHVQQRDPLIGVLDGYSQAADLFKDRWLWDADVAEDLTPACAALFSALASTGFSSEDTILCVQNLCTALVDTQTSSTEAAAICCMIAAVVQASCHAHSSILEDLADTIGQAFSILQATRDPDSHSLIGYLLAALQQAAIEQGCMLGVVQAVVVHISLHELAHEVTYKSVLAPWLEENCNTIIQGAMHTLW